MSQRTPTSQHPRVDLDALAAGQGVNSREAIAALMKIYADVDARNAKNTPGLDLPCHRGCDACCHESVFLTPLEFYCVWDWVQTHLDDATRSAVVERGLELFEKNRALIEALEGPPPAGERDHLRVAQQLRFTCPLLGPDGACRVYPVREIYARLFGCSFNDEGGIYGCHIVAGHLAGKVVTLLPVRGTARRLNDLPLTHKRQVYPYYLHQLYGG
ncbi:MAG: hypothetical protein HYZ27_09425 [Deltaproteobacteria bacterium]|nr:hypothetical protein [Deltaproteobacteria bacterium]